MIERAKEEEEDNKWETFMTRSGNTSQSNESVMTKTVIQGPVPVCTDDDQSRKNASTFLQSPTLTFIIFLLFLGNKQKKS